MNEVTTNYYYTEYIYTLKIKITKEVLVIDTKVANNGNIPIRSNKKVELQLGLRYLNLHQKNLMVKNGEKFESP